MKSRIITYLALYLSNKFENLFYSGGETTETSSDDEGPLQNIPAAQPQIQQPQRRPRYVKIWISENWRVYIYFWSSNQCLVGSSS